MIIFGYAGTYIYTLTTLSPSLTLPPIPSFPHEAQRASQKSNFNKHMSTPWVSRPSDFEYTRRVIIDDTDPRVSYDSGTWNLDASAFDNFGMFGEPYNRTMRGATSPKAGFTFHFEGDFIQIRGAKDNRKISHNDTFDSPDSLPKYICQVDGNNIQNVSYIPYIYATTNNVLCEGTRLPSGSHTLTMNITLDDPNKQIFWLDSIEYAYPEGADLSREVVKVQAGDRSCEYHNNSGTWVGMLGSSYGTEEINDSMSFRFNGTSVSVYTWNAGGQEEEWDSASGHYTIDGSDAIKFEIPESIPLVTNGQSKTNTDWYNQLLFKSRDVDGGREHDISITYDGTKTGAKAPQWLLIDHFYVVDAGRSPQGETNDGGESRGGGVESSQTKMPAAAIAGGVVGGVVGLLAIAGIVWFFLRRRRQRGGPRELYPKEELDPTPLIAGSGEHFHRPTSPALSLPNHPTRSIHSGDGTNTLSYHPATISTSLYSVSSADESATSGDGNASSYPSQDQAQNFSDMKGAQREAVSIQTRQHQDSGIRYMQDERERPHFVDVPPTYTAE
ncbi:hypothetical protein PM082_007145 [Marasmius tenuissimus]|nr:hypothetical protein PM082_007145 [Marasmius tenuissimus]